MDSDHSANTDPADSNCFYHAASSVSTGTLTTGEGIFRPGRLRAFALLLPDPSGVLEVAQPELAGERMRF